MDRIRIALERARMRRPAKSVLAVGLRGVGKTVLLLKSSEYAESKGMLVTRVEAPESRSLPALLGPGLRLAMIRLEKNRALANWQGAHSEVWRALPEPSR